MTQFVGVADKQPESAWGIWFPDVPGCTSAADTFEEIFLNACQAIEFHLENMEVPCPRSPEEIMKLKDVQDDIARGAVLLMVPLLSAEDRKVRVSVTGNAYLVEVIDDAARQRLPGRSDRRRGAATRTYALGLPHAGRPQGNHGRRGNRVEAHRERTGSGRR